MLLTCSNSFIIVTAAYIYWNLLLTFQMKKILQNIKATNLIPFFILAGFEETLLDKCLRMVLSEWPWLSPGIKKIITHSRTQQE